MVWNSYLFNFSRVYAWFYPVPPGKKCMLPLSHYLRMLLLPTSLPKTNSKFAHENGCLEYELVSFWEENPEFSGAKLLLVSGEGREPHGSSQRSRSSPWTCRLVKLTGAILAGQVAAGFHHVRAAFDLISSHEKNTTALKLSVLYCNGMVGNLLGVILDGHVWSLLMIWLSFASDLSSQRAITEPWAAFFLWNWVTHIDAKTSVAYFPFFLKIAV